VAFHPATVLLVWSAAVVASQFLSLAGLAWAALALLPIPLILARQRALLLLRRARWLLVSITVMFALATPGERLAGVWGEFSLTYDGLALAAEHALRLTLLLATLALLHERLGTNGMMAGVHWLLGPMAASRAARNKLVVRLMLVLDYVETAPVANWRSWLAPEEANLDEEAAALELTVSSPGAGDWAVISLLAIFLLAYGMSG
jgi:hypothetical protein